MAILAPTPPKPAVTTLPPAVQLGGVQVEATTSRPSTSSMPTFSISFRSFTFHFATLVSMNSEV